MRILAYIGKRFLWFFLVVLSIMLLLILIFDFIGMGNFFAEFGPTIGDVWLYVIYNTPNSLLNLLPMIVLLAAMFCYSSLAQRSELVAIRAFGMPLTRVVFTSVLITIVIGTIVATIANPLFVNARTLAEAQQDAIRGRDDRITQVAGNGIWLRESLGNQTRIIHFGGVNLNNRTANDVEFFIDTGNSREVIQAKQTHVNQNGDWILFDAVKIDFASPTSEEPIERLVLSANQNFDALFAPLTEPRQISNLQMRAHLAALDRDGYNSRPARAYFYQSLASPLNYGAMALIGAIFALAPFRGSNITVRLLLALSAGFALYALDSFVNSLGQAGYLPLWFAAIAISLLGLVLGYLYLLIQEDG